MSKLALRCDATIVRLFSLGLVGNVVPLRAEESVVDPLHGLEDFGVVVAKKRRVAAQKDEHDDSNGPQVARLVVLLGQH